MEQCFPPTGMTLARRRQKSNLQMAWSGRNMTKQDDIMCMCDTAIREQILLTNHLDPESLRILLERS